ncbi:hypothetical protein EOA35_07835, partial [Mesorhizobium sp. M8A.F.Ca.ET.023.01.1.1]
MIKPKRVHARFQIRDERERHPGPHRDDCYAAQAKQTPTVSVSGGKAGVERTSPRADRIGELVAWQEELRWRRSYWPQTTDFTCGPSCLLMAAQLLGVKGQPGCSPEGLGLAALRLGLETTIYQYDALELLQDECEAVEHKLIMRAVVESDRVHFLQAGGEMKLALPGEEDLRRHMARGNVLLCLVKELEDDGSLALHWVVLADIGVRSVLVLDPWNQDTPDPVRLERFSIKDFLGRISHGGERRGAVLALGKRRAQ